MKYISQSLAPLLSYWQPCTITELQGDFIHSSLIDGQRNSQRFRSGNINGVFLPADAAWLAAFSDLSVFLFHFLHFPSQLLTSWLPLLPLGSAGPLLPQLFSHLCLLPKLTFLLPPNHSPPLLMSTFAVSWLGKELIFTFASLLPYLGTVAQQ